MAQVQKKTTTMSLTISSCSRESSNSTVQQQCSSLVQPLNISPQRTQSPSCTQSYSSNGGVAPKFVKSLHDISTVKGQLVVLECRIRGTPPLQVVWYREHQQILDSADFRILRKKASSASVPEELCTLVITEAFPEDSGLIKCVASNQYGTVSCSALLEVYTDLEEVLANEETSGDPTELDRDDFPSLLRDAAGIPPPEWPDSPEEESAPMLDMSSQVLSKNIVEPYSPVGESNYSSLSHSSAEGYTPTPPPPAQEPLQSLSSAMSVTNLPTFSPTLYPPSAFNYERPRHFIQAGQINGAVSASSAPTTQPPVRSSVTLIPKPATNTSQQTSPVAFLCSVLPSQTPSASSPLTLPKPAVNPIPLTTISSLPTCHSPQTPPSLSPTPHKTPANISQASAPTAFVSLPASYRGSNSAPKPILKKTVPRPVSRSTDEEIQGSKDALIQDLEKQLRSKEARRKTSQKLSYEERMARRLLGPDNAASVFDLQSQAESRPEQPESPQGRHTGGLWSRHHASTEGDETSAIQEKCYAPRFLQVPQDLTVEEGRFCRIDFKVIGLPTPDVTWYLDGKAIRPDDYHKMLVSEKGLHSFIIEIVTIHHSGVYECVAWNRAGESRFTMRLEVIAQEVLRPPTFVQKMRNLRALEGDTVRLECKVSASPPPQLYWKKDKEMLRLDLSRMSVYQDNTGHLCLLIDRVEKADAGWYTLSAINEAGMSTCNARLDVGTRLNKTTPAGTYVKVRPVGGQFSSLSLDKSAPRQPAPLYESEEL